TTTLPIRYIMNRETHQPVVIPRKQMDNFIAVAGNYNEQLLYIENDPIILHKGDKVRITGGLFEGAIGTLMRIKGNRRVVVSIPGVIAVATTDIHPSLIEKIE
ncbi:MAG: transcriptional regulator, partial [Muribaculaceae bacterium]